MPHLGVQIPPEFRLFPTPPATLDLVTRIESESLQRPQVAIKTQHVIHAGVYARTIRIPAGTLLTGAFVKISTLLIFQGNARFTVGDDEALSLVGYHVIPAAARRKQAILAIEDTMLTMIFGSRSKTVESAEMEFTDDFDQLMSRVGENEVVITGD